MSTTTQHQAPAAEKQGAEPSPDRLVKCPVCGSLIHASELTDPPFQKFPLVIHRKRQEDPKVPDPGETKVVANDDELKKALADGWSEDAPKADDAKKPDPTKPVKPEEPAKPVEPVKPEPAKAAHPDPHNKK